MQKPDKPTPDFPLFAHANGAWCKKINGRHMYFGAWEDPDGALGEYMEFIRRDGNEHHRKDVVTISLAANQFLAAKDQAVTNGQITQRTFSDYQYSLKQFTKHFGRSTDIEELGTDDLDDYFNQRAKTRNLVSMGGETTRLKTWLLWLFEYGIISDTPRYPESWKRPSKKQMRRHKREVGSKVMAAEDVRKILKECGDTMKAAVLLGLNCGFSPSDCHALKYEHIVLMPDTGYLEIQMARVKTEVLRRCSLWPETLKALDAIRSGRPDYYFTTPDGEQITEKSVHSVSKKFSQIAKWCGSPATFYWLRHTHQNIGESKGDSIAVKISMGHSDNSISDTYRHDIPSERLRAVSENIRSWLYKDAPY